MAAYFPIVLIGRCTWGDGRRRPGLRSWTSRRGNW